MTSMEQHSTKLWPIKEKKKSMSSFFCVHQNSDTIISSSKTLSYGLLIILYRSY